MLAHFMYYKGPIDMSRLSVESLTSDRYADSNIVDEERAYLSDLSRSLNVDGKLITPKPFPGVADLLADALLGPTRSEVLAAWEKPNWHHDLYFVAQMFQPKYIVRDRYVCGK
jgi:hypothetical protein